MVAGMLVWRRYLLVYCLPHRCGDNGIKKLISGLEGNTKLLDLSLCYCDLGPESGSPLGSIVTQTAIW